MRVMDSMKMIDGARFEVRCWSLQFDCAQFALAKESSTRWTKALGLIGELERTDRITSELEMRIEMGSYWSALCGGALESE